MLDHKAKIPGLLLVIAGIILAVLYFIFDFRFEIPVLAVVSSYMETRFFATFKTNFADETIMLLLLIGFSLIVFSKEKKEEDRLREIRLSALKRTIWTDIGILLFTVLFVYGSGFIALLLLNMILPFVLYISFFYYLKKKKLSNDPA